MKISPILIFESILFETANKHKIKVEKEYRFHPTYQYRFDYALPDIMVAFEIEGGIYIQGRHTNPIGYTEDCIKYNLATFLGWKVYRFTTEQVKRNSFIFPTTQKPKRGFVRLDTFLSEIIQKGIQEKKYQQQTI